MVESREARIKKAKAYVKSKIWKQFFKQKLYELVIIPLAILSFWKVPLWLGWGLLNLFNVDTSTNTFFCTRNAQYNGTLVCTGPASDTAIWLMGFLIVFVLTAIIFVNWMKAKDIVKEEAKIKYNVYYGELEDD